MTDETTTTTSEKAKTRRRRKRGRGTIYKRADGRWCGELQLAGGGRKCVYGATAAEVERKITSVKHTLDGGGVLVEDDLTVGALVADFLAEREHRTRPATIGSYKRLHEHHIKPELGKVKARAFTSDALQAFVNRHVKAWRDSQAAIAAALEAKQKPPAIEGMSPSLMHHVLAVLRMTFKLALRRRKVMIDPTVGVHGPKVERNIPQPLDQAETQKLLTIARAHRLGAIWFIAASLGLRRGEVLGLRWVDVEIEDGGPRLLHVRQQLSDATGELTAPKTKKALRALHMSPVLVAALSRWKALQAAEQLKAGEDWCNADGLVFTGELGVPLDGGSLSKMHAALCVSAGVRHVRFHDLRHGAATLMLAAGVDPATLSAKLGHARVAFTLDTYVHPDQERLDDASERLADVLGLNVAK